VRAKKEEREAGGSRGREGKEQGSVVDLRDVLVAHTVRADGRVSYSSGSLFQASSYILMCIFFLPNLTYLTVGRVATTAGGTEWKGGRLSWDGDGGGGSGERKCASAFVVMRAW